MQGAPKRTSGRSHPWSAPLRATSSVLCVSTWRAVPKLLKMQDRRFVRFVGIALPPERFTIALPKQACPWIERCGGIVSFLTDPLARTLPPGTQNHGAEASKAGQQEVHQGRTAFRHGCALAIVRVARGLLILSVI